VACAKGATVGGAGHRHAGGHDLLPRLGLLQSGQRQFHLHRSADQRESSTVSTDLYDLGDIRLNMSGCMNACGHHHVGHIGILGVDKKGEEWYQISLGGSSETDVSLGDILGPSVR
jgi:sulfite reductase beta subunit-like hemoprotein